MSVVIGSRFEGSTYNTRVRTLITPTALEKRRDHLLEMMTTVSWELVLRDSFLRYDQTNQRWPE